MISVQVPSGECPVKLTAYDRDTVMEWAHSVRERGHRVGKHYTVSALVYWGRQQHIISGLHDFIEALKYWLVEEFPDERPLSTTELNMLNLERSKPAAAKEQQLAPEVREVRAKRQKGATAGEFIMAMIRDLKTNEEITAALQQQWPDKACGNDPASAKRQIAYYRCQVKKPRTRKTNVKVKPNPSAVQPRARRRR